MRGSVHLVVDVQDLAIGSDDKRRSAGVAVGLGGRFGGVAEDGIIELQRFGKPGVGIRIVATGGEVGYLELTQGVAALTERNALFRSAAGKCFGVPRDDHRLLAGKVG